MFGIKERIARITDRQLILFALILVFPAMLLNLGTMTFIGDEAIRAQVALEMKLSGNYIVPTLHGVPYFNKPPLYNWFILAVSGIWGNFGEWPSRLCTLLFLGLFAFSVYHFTRRHFDQLTAATAAFMVLTSGRILIWDALLGLIDICFSLVIYLNFMVLYHLGVQKKWLKMFVLSYLLTAAAFLLKGLPAIVFEGISVLVALQLHGELRKKIFSKAHFLGMAVGILPVVIYYGLYVREVSLSTAFATLFDQSMQRTATHFGIYKTIIHLFTFPFEQVYHFLPWSLMILIFFHPKFWKWINSHPFIKFNFWMAAANLPVYWTSVEVYPRYLLMFVPLFNIVCTYALQSSLAENKQWWRVLKTAFAILSVAAALVFWLIPTVARARELPWLIPVWLGCSLLLTFAAISLIYNEKRMFLWLSIVMLTFRIGIDTVILPFRMVDDKAHFTRDDAARLAKKWGAKDWYILGETETHRVAGFYLTNALQKIVHKTNVADNESAIYIVDTQLYPNFNGTQVDSLRLENGAVLPLMQPKKEQ